MEGNNLSIIVYLFGYQLEQYIKIWQIFLDYLSSFQLLVILSLQKTIELVIKKFQTFTPEGQNKKRKRKKKKKRPKQ
jgi:N-glycosylase/DNA lyase